MAQRFKTDGGTAFVSPLVLVNSDNEILGDVALKGDIGIGIPDTHAVYVSKSGNNTNEGTKVGLPKLTISSAVTQAEALLADGASTVAVQILDGGTYSESLTIPSNIHVIGTAATLVGTVTLGNNSGCTLNRHYASANDQNLVQKGSGSGHGFYKTNVTDMRGTSGTLTGGQALRNVSNGSVLFAFVGVLYVSANATGVSDGAAGFGHIHFWTPDLYLAGNDAVGISAQNLSNFIGYIDHILEFGTPNGSIGIRLTNAGAVVKVTASEIIAETAYSISSGNLHVSCPRIVGTRTGTPACEISNMALRGAWGLLDAVNPA